MDWFHYEAKRQLCLDIAKAYRLKGLKQFRTSIDSTAGGVDELSTRTEDKSFLGLVSVFGAFAGLHQASEYDNETKKYEDLANSKKLYFIKKSKLEWILKALPVERKQRSYPIKMTDGRIHVITVK